MAIDLEIANPNFDPVVTYLAFKKWIIGELLEQASRDPRVAYQRGTNVYPWNIVTWVMEVRKDAYTSPYAGHIAEDLALIWLKAGLLTKTDQGTDCFTLN